MTFLHNHVRSIQFRLLAYLGDLAELEQLMSGALPEVDRIGDVFTATNLRAGSLLFLRLAADQPELARSDLAWVAERLPATRFLLQHYFHLLAVATIALYEGRAVDAERLIEGSWGKLRRSLLLHVSLVRTVAIELRGRAAIAAAVAESDGRAARLARAEECARLLACEQMTFSDGHASLLHGTLRALGGDRVAALRDGEEAQRHFERAGMRLQACATQLARGALQGGAEGRLLRDSAVRDLERLGVAAPYRFAALVAPGWKIDEAASAATTPPAAPAH